MKNRMVVAQRSAGRLTDAEHVYQPHPINRGATGGRSYPAEAWTLTSSAGELFPSDSAGTELRGPTRNAGLSAHSATLHG